MKVNRKGMGGFAKQFTPPPTWVATPCTPKAANGCPRCPQGRKTPCEDLRHLCPDCAGLGIRANYERCNHDRITVGDTTGTVVDINSRNTTRPGNKKASRHTTAKAA